MGRVEEVYREVQAAFAAEFGRPLADALVPYRMEDAEIVVVSMGTTGSTARAAVDAARARGIKAGALRVRLFRPLPEAGLRRALAGKRHVAVLDRDLSPGLGGILWGEIRACAAPGAVVQNYLVGLGGGDIRPEQIERILGETARRDHAAEPIFVEVG